MSSAIMALQARTAVRHIAALCGRVPPCVPRSGAFRASSTTPVTPRVAGDSPIQVELQAGKSYSWCTCGHSAKQPWCDGSHKKIPATTPATPAAPPAPAFKPLRFTAAADESAWMCTCKHTTTAPRCDGSHLRFRPKQ